MGRRELHSSTFQPRPIDPPNRDILKVMWLEGGVTTKVHQVTAAQGKAAIPDIMTITELWPAGTDIIIIHEVRSPAPGVKNISIPLYNKTMGCLYMIGQNGKKEI